MSDLFQIVDPVTDVVVVDLNDLSDGNQYGFGTLDDNLDLGPAEPDVELIGDDDVASVTWPPVEMTIPVHARGTSYDDLIDRVNDLGEILAKGGYALKVQPEGAAEARWADLLPSPIQALLRPEEEQGLHVIGQAIDPAYPLEITRKALWRGPVQTVGPVDIDQGLVRGFVVPNPGSAPGLLKVTIEPTGGRVVQAIVAERSSGNLNDFLEWGFWPASDMVEKVATNQVADADAHGGQALQVVTADQGMTRRARIVRTPDTDATAIGVFRLFATIRVTDTGRYRVQGRYAYGDRNPADVALPAIDVDTTDLEDFDYFAVALGDIDLSAYEGGPVTIEAWSEEIESAGNLRFSDFALMPVDERFSVFQVPGFWRAGSDPTTWRGDTLRVVEGPVSVSKKNDLVRLNTEDDSVGIPGGPIAIETGRHRVQAKVTLKNNEETDAVLGYLRVYQGGAVVKSHRLKGRKNRQTTTRTVELAFDAADGLTYDYRVEFTNKPAGSQAKITVHWIRDSFQRYAGNGDAFVIDGVKRQAMLVTDGTEATRLAVARGGFPVVAPGQGLVLIRLGDDPGTGYKDVIEEGAVAKHAVGREAAVTIDLTPRYFTA